MKKLVSQTFYLFLAYLSTIFSCPFVMADAIKFVETTGRAAIVNDESINNARRNALEDAIFLAAIHGGAKIDGFTAVDVETNLSDHLIVRPAGELLDYTILEEKIGDEHYETTIRAAIGTIGTIECSKRSQATIIKYGAEFEFSSNVPAWLRQIAPEIEKDIGTLLNKQKTANVTEVSPTKLDINRLLNTDDDYDYTSLTRGTIRVATGDFALVPTIAMQVNKSKKNIETEFFLRVSINSALYQGVDYELLENIPYEVLIKLRSETPWRTFDILSGKTRGQIKLSIKSGLKNHILELMDRVQCIPLTAKIKLQDSKLVVDLGHSHGITPTSLAVSAGSNNTPYSILHVTQVRSNQAIVEPLNKSLEISSLVGKTINFME